MENWPEPKWGHPLPKVSKYLRPRALIWLTIIIGITSLSLLGSYIYANRTIDEDSLITFPDDVVFPFTSEFKEEADHLASSIDRKAKAISISYVLANPKSNKIKYNPILVYCIPQNPSWLLKLNIQVNRSVFSQNHYQARKLEPGENYQYDCSSDEIVTPSIPAPEAILIAQRFMLSNYSPEDFKWPDRIHLMKVPSQGFVWKFVYDDFSSESTKLELQVNSGSGIVTMK
jgi:hypothetical protein